MDQQTALLVIDVQQALCAGEFKAFESERVIERINSVARNSNFLLFVKMILDHIGITVSDYNASKAFFSRALGPLGILLVAETHGWAGFGANGKPELWFGPGQEPHRQMHLAFLAGNREQVRQFYVAALEAGAKDNGQPDLRPHYHPNYYGAFVIGPDGHNVEAVCHAAEV